jgi:putative phosphoesterase
VRIALISDIHGNLLGLDAVLSALREDGAREIVCLGDVATLGPEPEGVVRRLQELNLPCILGNHDAYLLGASAALGATNMPTWMKEQISWAAHQLSDGSREFVGSFQESIRIPLGESGTLLCVHGSPRSNEEMILPTTPPSELDIMLQGLEAAVLAHGHYHLQAARRHRNSLLVNPGSVGEPLAEIPFKQPEVLPWAEYALLETSGGNLGLQLRRVPYDTAALVLQFKGSSMPNAGFWADLWRLSSS